MTIKEAQDLVAAWAQKKPQERIKSDLTAMADLTEEVGELSRVIARKYGNPNASKSQLTKDLTTEIGDILWALTTIANATDIDLTEALITNFEKKEIEGEVK